MEIAQALKALIGLVAASAAGSSSSDPENEVRKMTSQSGHWVNDAAATGTNAIAEIPIFVARQKCRIVGVKFCPQAALTGTATNYMTLLVAKRPASAPGTPVNLVTYAVDTATTDDIAAYAARDLLAAATLATYVPTAVGTDFELQEGDVITIQVTKAGTGMTFPTGTVFLIAEPRS
jgi:hypothetical protein